MLPLKASTYFSRTILRVGADNGSGSLDLLIVPDIFVAKPVTVAATKSAHHA
jgi:hypothetical protein